MVAKTEQEGASPHTKSKAGLVGCGVLALTGVLAVAMCSAGDATPSVPDEPSETAKDDAVAFHEAFLKAVGPCDTAFEVAGAEMQKGDVIRSYRAAQVAEQACREATRQIAETEVPASLGRKAYDEMLEARSQCLVVYENKRLAIGNIADMLDGQGGVAQLARTQESVEGLQGGTLLCVAKLFTPLVTLDVDLEQFDTGNSD